MAESGTSDVGSLGRELADLVRVMATQTREESREEAREARLSADAAADGSSEHRCPHGWCPVCGVVELVQDHPELVEHVMEAAGDFLQAVRDVADHMTSRAGGAHARRDA